MRKAGESITLEAMLGMIIPIIAITTICGQLLLVPLIFVAVYIVAVVRYVRSLTPVARRQRDQFGKMNAGLEETISGIEVVKASGQENFERRKFRSNARLFRDFFVKQGYLEARYLPMLLYGIMIGFAFLHAMLLNSQGVITLPQLISFMAVVAVLQWPTFASIFTFTLIQNGLAGARRILSIIQQETELDENAG